MFSHDAVQENTVYNFLDDTNVIWLKFILCIPQMFLNSGMFSKYACVFVCVCLFFLIFQTGRVYTFRVQHVNTFIQVIPTTRHTLTRALELWNSVKNDPVNQLFSQVVLHFTRVLCNAEPDGSAGRRLSDARVFLLHLHRMTCKIKTENQRKTG